MPCRTSIGPHRSGGQLRRGGCADAGASGVGGGGGGGGGHPCILPMGWTRDARGALKAESKIPVSREQKARQIVGQIVSSLIFAQNSGRRFQTHISNSGEQIPKHARQNSEGGRFPVSHYKTRSRGHRFLGTYFSILVSEFKFPARPRIWEA